MWVKEQKTLVCREREIKSAEMSERLSRFLAAFQPLLETLLHLCPPVLRNNLYPFKSLSLSLFVFSNALANSSWFLLLATKRFKWIWFPWSLQQKKGNIFDVFSWWKIFAQITQAAKQKAPCAHRRTVWMKVGSTVLCVFVSWQAFLVCLFGLVCLSNQSILMLFYFLRLLVSVKS